MKSPHKRLSVAENTASIRRDADLTVDTVEHDDAADEGVVDVFRNVALLSKEDMKIWMTPSLYVPQGSTLGGGLLVSPHPP